MTLKPCILSFLVLVSGTVLACGSAQPPKSPPETPPAPEPCNFEDPARTVWNADVKADLMLPLKILQGTFEAQEAEMLTNKLDLFTVDWISMRGSVCRDHAAGRIASDDEYQARVDCFDSILDIQQTIILSIEEGDRTVLEQIGYLSDALEPCISLDHESGEEIRLNPFDE
jgi:hypothetical protein